jgi:hypothetical protein
LVGFEQDLGVGQGTGRTSALTDQVWSRARSASDRTTVERLRMLDSSSGGIP